MTAHEAAHHWWGQTVGFASFRDQWMSEGFANFSAALFLKNTRPNVPTAAFLVISCWRPVGA